MLKKTKKYEESLNESLKNPREAAAYLNAHLDEDDELFLLALRDVAKVYGFGEISHQSSLGRESLYKALSKDGNPKFSTLKAILKVMGLKLTVEQEHKKAS